MLYNDKNMLVSNLTILEDFVQKHAQAVKPLNRWLKTVENAKWKNHNELKNDFPSADYVGNGRYVFNISGNNFRLVTVVLFVGEIVMIRFAGTHAEYSQIDKCSEL